MWFAVVLTVLTGYMLGNLNGAVSMSNLLAKKDVREQGSGNAGLTNFLRMFGPGSALLVVCIDMLKAVVACLVGKYLLAPYGYGFEGVLIGGWAVILGHDFPALLGFHGGKGVLSGVTVALVADWRLGLLALAVGVILGAVYNETFLPILATIVIFAVIMLVAIIALLIYRWCMYHR